MVDYEQRAFADAAAWEAWLEAEHATSEGVWLQLARKAAGIPSVSRPESLDLALRYGWIDGQSRSLDERYYLQKYTPRRARSRWSQVNCRRVEELIELGLMKPAGLAEVERARADGRWEAAYAPPSRAVVPPDLATALAGNPAAEAFFGTLTGQNRYAILHRVEEAKRAETRARRIVTFVEMLAEGRTLL